MGLNLLELANFICSKNKIIRMKIHRFNIVTKQLIYLGHVPAFDELYS